MSNILGPYCSFWHWRGEDEEYIRLLDPAWARIHQPNARGVWTVQRNAPNANVMLRSWDIDDHNGDRKREMYADPIGAARKHIELWDHKRNELIAELSRNGWSADISKWFYGLVNEPDPAYASHVVDYSLEAMRLAKDRKMHLGVVCSSVGTFSKPSENANGWALFKSLEKPINDGRHILICHEYWQPEGPNYGEDGGNLAWRHRSIPLDVPILIGEAGANGYIYQRHSKDDDAGWQKFMPPEQYAAQVKEYIEGCDTRVKGVLLYMLDYHSAQWKSFDTQPAMHQLLAIAGARPTKPSPFSVGTAPAPPMTPTAVVNVPAGANLREGPGTNYNIRGAVATGTPLSVVGKSVHGAWWQVDSQMGKVWVAGSVVALHNVDNVPVVESEPLQPPTPSQGDKWKRSLAFILRWEGGWAEHPNDPGGATNKGITIGTYTRWRASQGQPAPTKTDLARITDAEVETIYREWYWIASGADKLPWPNCLAVFDLAVNGGVGRAKQFVSEVGVSFIPFMARRLDWYTRIDGWKHFGAAWTRRCSDLMREAAK